VSDRIHAARDEHTRALADLLDRCETLAAGDWNRANATQWSAADVVEHLRLSYALVPTSPTDSGGMAVERSAAVAWITRNLVLRAALAMGVFPAGGRAPRAVQPDRVHAATRTREEALGTLRTEADRAVAILIAAARRRERMTITHAYFGAMSPLLTLRVLTAHTRHHARRL
jgi:hypothetical protein